MGHNGAPPGTLGYAQQTGPVPPDYPHILSGGGGLGQTFDEQIKLGDATVLVPRKPRSWSPYGKWGPNTSSLRSDEMLIARFSPATSRPKRIKHMIAQLNDFSSDQVAELQHRLFNAGLMPAAYYSPRNRKPLSGMLDRDTRDAFKDLLELAAYESSRGKTVDDVLNDLTAQNGEALAALLAGDGERDVTSQVSVVDTVDPQQLGLLVQDVAMQITGKKLDEARVGEIVNSINARRRGNQEQQIAAVNAQAEAAAPGNPAAVPLYQEDDLSVERAVQEQVHRADPAGVAAYSGIQTFADILGWLRGGA